MSKTLFKRVEQFRDRWSSFGTETGIRLLSEKLAAAELRQFDLFKEYDETFLETISPDISLADWKADAILFEEGSYIDLAFFIIEGQVSVTLEGLDGRGSSSAPIFAPSTTVGGSTVQQPTPAHTGTIFYSPTATRKTTVPTFLATMDFDFPAATDAARLGPGEIFGEIGALSGWPQSVTARTVGECKLLQIRLPALRLMKRRSKAFKDRLDQVYRERSLLPQMSVTPVLSGLSESQLQRLGESAELISCEPHERLIEQGGQADGLYLLRSGFLKLSEDQGSGPVVMTYLSKGSTLGEIEALMSDLNRWTYSADSVGYSELVRIRLDTLLPVLDEAGEIKDRLWESAVHRLKSGGPARNDPALSEFTEFALSQGLVEGSSVLVIDLNRCTRCDDCVRACADTHSGRPRFVREGDRYDNLLIAKACYHCEDPVCLIGCPTGAIRRANVGDVVEIREDICIGCGTCANNCPYDAIVMHDTGFPWADDALPKALRGEERFVASKCDLCYTSSSGPACVRNCPQGCAFRIGSVDEFRSLLSRPETESREN